MQRPAAVGGQALQGRHGGAVGLHRQHGARLHRLTVEVDGASTARRSLATHVRGGEAEDVAQVVDQQQARLDLVGVRLPVDGDRDG